MSTHLRKARWIPLAVDVPWTWAVCFRICFLYFFYGSYGTSMFFLQFSGDFLFSINTKMTFGDYYLYIFSRYIQQIQEQAQSPTVAMMVQLYYRDFVFVVWFLGVALQFWFHPFHIPGIQPQRSLCDLSACFFLFFPTQ